jgi:hypothetical protein
MGASAHKYNTLIGRIVYVYILFGAFMIIVYSHKYISSYVILCAVCTNNELLLRLTI